MTYTLALIVKTEIHNVLRDNLHPFVRGACIVCI
jgi:hypothetical protein